MHSSISQPWYSIVLPKQGRPPLIASGLLQLRCRLDKPRLHVTEQCDQLPHGVQFPLTILKQTILMSAYEELM